MTAEGKHVDRAGVMKVCIAGASGKLGRCMVRGVHRYSTGSGHRRHLDTQYATSTRQRKELVMSSADKTTNAVHGEQGEGTGLGNRPMLNRRRSVSRRMIADSRRRWWRRALGRKIYDDGKRIVRLFGAGQPAT